MLLRLFARVYDRFVAWHSGRASASMRGALAALAVTGSEARVLDLCCGTGAVTRGLAERLPAQSLVVGLDFSAGMLGRARLSAPAGHGARIRWVQADASALPSRTEAFDVVTCAYALYELKGAARTAMLREVARTLRGSGRFLAMEHEQPSRPLARLLFSLRLAVIGAEGARAFLGGEVQEFGRAFHEVSKDVMPPGKSKILTGKKGPDPRAEGTWARTR